MNSIRRQLAVNLLLGFGVLWLAGATLVFLGARAVLVNEFDAALAAKAQALASVTEQGAGKVELDDAEEFDRIEAKLRSPSCFQIWFADGTVVMRSATLGTNDLPVISGNVQKPHFRNLTLPGGVHGRGAGIRFTPRPDPDGRQPATAAVLQDLKLVVASPRASLDRALGWLLVTLLCVAVLAAATTVLLVVRVVRVGLAPVATIADRAAAIDACSLGQRFPTETVPAELRPICERLNELMARLHASFARERRFSADVAHELRTPIAELRSLAEVALKWPDDREATTQAIQDARQIALQMEALVTRLLAMVRCEAGTQTLQLEPVAIAELLAEVLRPLQPQTDAKQLAVTLAVPAGASIVTDRAMFQSVLANLLANAVEYAPSRGKFDVRFVGDVGHFTLTVANTVTGLTYDDLPHFFERFWRKDAARSGSEHCGLGLALSRTVAEALGLRLTAALIAPGTLTLSIERLRLVPETASKDGKFKAVEETLC